MEREQDKRTLKMPNKVKLTSEFVAKPPPLEPGRDRTIFWDTKTSCFGLQVTKSDHRSFVVQYRAGRESRRKNFKVEIGLEQARKKAMAILGDAAKGHDPLGDERAAKKLPKTTLKSVVENWLKREGGELRTVEDRRTAFEQMVYPELGSRQISEIDRDHINDLLDDIEDEHSARTATLVLAYVRKVFNWYAIRKKDFVSPIVRGMARGKTTKRKRILNDDEIRAVWTTADRLGTPFARMLQYILLTATRRSEAARMDRAELESITTWMIPAARYKTKIDHVVPLSRAALAVLDRLPVIGAADRGPVFTLDGVKPIAGFGKWKAAFDAECGVTGWTVHDLRRTARSLMPRARIDPDIAERCVGHIIGGVRGVYDRYEYLDEKREAFDALAQEIGRVISGSIGPAPYRALGQIIIVTWAHSPVAVNDNPAAEDHEEFRPRAG